MNDTQRKLIHTALKQTNYAKSNISSAVHLEGLHILEVDEAWQELDRAWRRLWNTLHGGTPFIVPPPAETHRLDSKIEEIVTA